MWIAKLVAHGMSREAALEVLTSAFNDAVKTNYEDANNGPVMWGRSGRTSGLTIEEMDMMEVMTPGFPEGRLRFERKRERLRAELEEVEKVLNG